MKTLVTILLLGCLTAGVRAQLLPSSEESQAQIALLQKQIDSVDKVINAIPKPVASANDLILRFKRSTLNSLFSAYATYRTDDVRLTLLPTRPLWSEKKSFLGVTMQNSVDVDSGVVLVDIKKFECLPFNRNTVEIVLELEGGGAIGVSGRYAGIPIHLSPGLALYLQEKVRFSIQSAGADNVLLKHDPHTLLLKTKMTLHYLDWTLPYYREVPIEADGLMGPIVLPLSVSSTVQFPVPWEQDATRRLSFVPRKVQLSHTSVWAQGEQLEFRGDITFVR